MARRSLRIEARRQDKMKPAIPSVFLNSDLNFNEDQLSGDINLSDNFSRQNFENFAIRIQSDGKVKPYAVKRSQMKSLRKSKLKLPSKKIVKGSQETIAQLEFNETENPDDSSSLPALIVTELSSSSKSKEFILPNGMSIKSLNPDEENKENQGESCLGNGTYLPQKQEREEKKSLDWKEISDERKGEMKESLAEEARLVCEVKGSEQPEDKVVRDLQEFLQLGAERRRVLPREPPPVIVVKVSDKESEPRETKRVPDVTKSARQLTGPERDAYLREMKDSILRDLNPGLLRSLMTKRCGEVHVDLSPKFPDPAPPPPDLTRYLTGNPMWTDTDKYKYKPVFKDIKATIENFESTSGAVIENSRCDSSELEGMKAPKRMYRKKVADEKLEAWYQYNLQKTLQVTQDYNRKQGDSWSGASSGELWPQSSSSQDSANLGFLESSTDLTFEASEILGSSTPISYPNHAFASAYLSFTMGE